jgi:hypothetical protein
MTFVASLALTRVERTHPAEIEFQPFVCNCQRTLGPTLPSDESVELIGIEPTTSGLQSRRSPS